VTQPNVLLIGIDSLRADRLGCYGYPKPTTPNLDLLAKSASVFDACFAPGVPTQPSFTTLFTGQYPTTHGIVAHRGRWQLAEDAPFLSELLQAAGYTTAAVDNLADQHQPWFSRGFDTYLNPRKRGTFPDCFRFNEPAIDWLENRPGDDPFLLFVHYWDPHTPYDPPERYRSLFYDGDPCSDNPGSLAAFYERPVKPEWVTDWLDPMAAAYDGSRITDIDFVRAMYDAEVRCADEGVGELLGSLDRLGLEGDTIVIVLGDHGEALGENGIYFDHHGLYDSVIRVPMLIRWPGMEGGRTDALVEHSDLAPTLLTAAGLEPPDSMDGKSLQPLLSGCADAVREPVLLTEECTWMAKWALRRDGWKLILAREQDFYGGPMRELYDLAADPGETLNLAEVETDRARAMDVELEALLNERLARAGRTDDPVRTHGITLGKSMFR